MGGALLNVIWRVVVAVAAAPDVAVAEGGEELLPHPVRTTMAETAAIRALNIDFMSKLLLSGKCVLGRKPLECIKCGATSPEPTEVLRTWVWGN